jgi:hypothetical protein
VSFLENHAVRLLNGTVFAANRARMLSASNTLIHMGHSARRRSQHHHEQDRRWIDALQYAFDQSVTVGLLHDDKTPISEVRPRVRVLSVNNAGNRIEIELRFLAGERYSSVEWVVFLPTYSRKWWESLRADVRDVCDREPPSLSFLVHGVVEAGAHIYLPWGVWMTEREGYGYTSPPCEEQSARF